MSFDASKYESQIRAILQAPNVDLSTISAKRVRKQLLEQNDDLTAELVKERKEELDALIGNVYEQVSAELGGEDAESEVAPTATEDGVKRKREEDGDMSDVPASPAASKKARKNQKAEPLTDEELARQINNELNGRERPTRAAAASKPAKPKKRTRKPKAADSDAEGSGGDKPKKRRGGFTKEYALSEPLSALLETDKMSRPQVVKHIWDYIKEKGLQNPADRREIICDERMKLIFGMDKIGMFKMNKMLGDHLYEATAA